MLGGACALHAPPPLNPPLLTPFLVPPVSLSKLTFYTTPHPWPHTSPSRHVCSTFLSTFPFHTPHSSPSHPHPSHYPLPLFSPLIYIPFPHSTHLTLIMISLTPCFTLPVYPLFTTSPYILPTLLLSIFSSPLPILPLHTQMHICILFSLKPLAPLFSSQSSPPIFYVTSSPNTHRLQLLSSLLHQILSPHPHMSPLSPPTFLTHLFHLSYLPHTYTPPPHPYCPVQGYTTKLTLRA